MSALSNTIIAQVGALVTPYAGKLDQGALLNLIDAITNKFVNIETHLERNEPSAHVMETASHETHQQEVGLIDIRTTLGQKTIGGKTPKGKWDLRTQEGRDGAAAESLMQGAPVAQEAPQEAKLSQSEPSFPRMEPAIAIKDSVTPDHISCLHCGEQLKYLRRHLKAEHNQTVDQYKAHWNLPENYPIVAPAYAQLRQKIALEQGLGRKPKTTEAPVGETAPREPKRFEAKPGVKLDGRSKEARALKAQAVA